MYRVTDKNGNEVKRGDTIIDFRGDKAQFVEVAREKGEGREALVTVIESETTATYYASVYELTVKPIVQPRTEGERKRILKNIKHDLKLRIEAMRKKNAVPVRFTNNALAVKLANVKLGGDK